MNEFEFEIPKWAKHQTRKDLKSMTWFRTQGDIFFDHKFHDLRAMTKLFWVFLLSECCRANAGKLRLSCRYAAKVSTIRVNDVRFAVDELERNQMIVVHSRDEIVPYGTEQNRTNRTERNSSDAPASRVKTARKNSSSTQGGEKKVLQPELNSAKTESPQTNQTELAIQTEPKINLLGHYIDLWRSKYGTQMPRKNSDGAILKRIAQANGHEQTIKMIEAYFAMPDAWAVKKAHDLFTFERMLAEVVRFMNTGSVVTNYAAKEVDETVHYRQKNATEEAESMARMRQVREAHEKKLKMLETGKVQND
jgi:hypothetical protein